jgi:hypothetical protein
VSRVRIAVGDPFGGSGGGAAPVTTHPDFTG